jgi:hypothetical protein
MADKIQNTVSGDLDAKYEQGSRGSERWDLRLDLIMILWIRDEASKIVQIKRLQLATNHQSTA